MNEALLTLLQQLQDRTLARARLAIASPLAPHLVDDADWSGVLRVVAANKQLATRNHFILMTAHVRSLPLAFAHLLVRLHVLVLPKPFDRDRVLTMVADAARTLPAR
jgi:hypothetical protein